MTWYKSGTVTVTPGSNAVIGMGTAFIANSRVGDAFRGPDGGWYEVTNIASNTALSISPPYGDPSAYALAPIQGYVKDSADALRAATGVIASGVADMQEQVAAATEAAAVAVQAGSVAADKAGIATAAADLSTQNREATAQDAESAVQAASRSETARDSIVGSEAAAAASAQAAADSAEEAEMVTRGKAASGANSDITSLSGLTTPLSVAQGGTGHGASLVRQPAGFNFNSPPAMTCQYHVDSTGAGGPAVGDWLVSQLWIAPDYMTQTVYSFANGTAFTRAKSPDWSPWIPISGIMKGATASVAGVAGVVPAPAAGDQLKFLSGDGTFKAVSGSTAWGAITGTLSAQTDLQNALDARIPLGNGQTYQDMSTSRALATAYTNTTGRTIWAYVHGTGTSGASRMDATVDGKLFRGSTCSVANNPSVISFAVPIGVTYSINSAGSGSITPASVSWLELRT